MQRNLFNSLYGTDGLSYPQNMLHASTCSWWQPCYSYGEKNSSYLKPAGLYQPYVLSLSWQRRDWFFWWRFLPPGDQPFITPGGADAQRMVCSIDRQTGTCITERQVHVCISVDWWYVLMFYIFWKPAMVSRCHVVSMVYFLTKAVLF